MKRLFVVFFMFSSILFANIGKVTLLEGEAFLKRDGLSNKLNLGDSIKSKDFIETKVNSKIKITFIDNTIITIGKESNLNIDDYFFQENTKEVKSELSVAKGAFHAITGEIAKINPSKFKLKTKNASIGIRGTEFYGDETRIFCTKGTIFVEAFDKIAEIKEGYFVSILENKSLGEVLQIDTKQFEEVNSKLNVNNLSNNNLMYDFENRSEDLSLSQGYQEKLLNESIDNLNSWGYWDEIKSDIESKENRYYVLLNSINHNNQGQTNQGQTNQGQTNQGQTNQGQTNQGQTNQGQTNQGQTNQGQTNQGQTNQGQTNQNLQEDIRTLNYLQNLISPNNAAPTRLTYNGQIKEVGVNVAEINELNFTFTLYSDQSNTNSVLANVNFQYQRDVSSQNFSGSGSETYTLQNNTFLIYGLLANNDNFKISGKFFGQEADSIKGSVEITQPGNSVKLLDGNFDIGKQ